jgi:hypothetical protein
MKASSKMEERVAVVDYDAWGYEIWLELQFDGDLVDY